MIQSFGESRRGAFCQKGSLTISPLCPGGGDSSRPTLVPSQSRSGIDRRPGCVARALVHVTTRYVGSVMLAYTRRVFFLCPDLEDCLDMEIKPAIS